MSNSRGLRRQVQRESLKGENVLLKNQVQVRDSQIQYERLQRVSAQRGLVVYVRALEAFNLWLKENPNPTVEDEMRKLGIYGVKLGYDPDEDPEILAIGHGA